MSIWEVLGISPTRDPLKIRRAYAEQSKNHHPESDPEGFRILYEAYQEALKEAKQQKRRPMLQRRVIEAIGNKKDEEKKQAVISAEETKTSADSEQTQQEQKEEETSEEEFNFGALMRRFQQAEAEEKRQYEKEGALHELILLFTDKEQSKSEAAWKSYFTSNMFLDAQYDLKFIRYLTEYLREQRLVEVSKLMRPLFNNLCIVYGLFVGQDPIFHAEALNDLLKLLNNHEKRTEYLKALFTRTGLQQEIEAWHLYRSFVELNSTESRMNPEAWKRALSVLRNEYNPKTNRKRGNIFYQLLAHFLESMNDMTPEIYKVFYDRFEYGEQTTSSREKRLYRPVYEVMNKLQNPKLIAQVTEEQEKLAQIRLLMSDYERLYRKAKEDQLTTEEAKIFFQKKRFLELKDTKEMIRRLGDYYKNRTDVPYALWKETYQLYEGKEHASVLLNFMEYGGYYRFVKQYKRACATEAETMERILPGEELRGWKERERWIRDTFFYSDFTLIWNSATKGAMRTVYRERLSEILWASASESDFQHDQEKDGIITIFWGKTVSFYFNQDNKRVTVSREDFYALIADLVQLYLNQYFCTASEKKTMEESLEALEQVVYPKIA